MDKKKLLIWEPLIEAAKKVDKKTALKFLERLSEDEKLCNEKGLKTFPLFFLRELLESIPEEEK